MSENYSYSTVANRVFDITNEMFHTYLKTLTLGQERALNLTRLVAEQSRAYEAQNRALINEFSGEVERTRELVRETVRESAKRGEEVISQARANVSRTVEQTRSALNQTASRVSRGFNSFRPVEEVEVNSAN